MDTDEQPEPTPTTSIDAGPALFDWQEMARRIGRKPDWVRRHTKQLPHHRMPGNRVMFSQQCVDLFLEQTIVKPKTHWNVADDGRLYEGPPGGRTARSRALDSTKRRRERERRGK